MLSGFVFNPKVEPLMMGIGIAIRPNVKMVFIIFLHYILQISTLKAWLKTYTVFAFSLCFSILTKDNFFFMGVDEYIGQLSL